MLVEPLVIDAQRDLAKKLDEAAISVVGKTLIPGLRNQTRQCFVVQAEIQDRVHHARH